MKKNKLAIFIAMLSVSVVTFGITPIVFPSQAPIETKAWSLDVKPNYPSNYYNDCKGLTGKELKLKLRAINQPSNKGYDWKIEDADEYHGDSSKILCMYTRKPIAKKDKDSQGSLNKYWNREHVWPQSLLKSGKEDRHNYWACDKKSNNIRGNYKYGEVPHIAANQVGSEIGVITDCYFDGKTFEPCDEAKGEAARTVMYDLVTHAQTDNIESIFKDQSLILKWHVANPVTPREIYRNNYVYGIQNNRNPFVDHPEYANAIFGDGTLGPTDPTLTMPETSEVVVGGTVSVAATLTGSSKTISYSSSNNGVASVNSQGLVQGISQGSATITASVNGTNLSKNCVVTVKNPAKLENIAIKIASTTLEIGQTSKLSVTPIPSNAKCNVTYSVDDPTVLNINNQTGDIKALKEGSAIITATDKTNPNIKNSVTITVVKAIEVAHYKRVEENRIDFSGKYLIAYQFMDGNNQLVNVMNSASTTAINTVAGELDNNGNILAKYSDHEFNFIKLDNGHYYIKNNVGDAFLHNSSKSGVKYGTPNMDDELIINIGADASDVTIKFASGNPILQYNTGSPRFQFYGSKIQNSKLEIYERVLKDVPPTPDPDTGGGDVPSIKDETTYPNDYPTSDTANFKKVTSNLNNYEGIYAIGSEVNGQVYFLDNTKDDSGINVISKTKSDDNIYHLEKALMIKIVKDNNLYRIMHSTGQCYGPKSGGNGILFGDPGDTNALTIVVNNGIASIDAGSKSLQFNTGASRMRFYGSAQKDVSLYRLQYDQFLYNFDFLNTVTCDNGVTKPSKVNWAKAKEMYNHLSNEDQNATKTALINDEIIGQALERYDYIIRKYGESEYENFMARTITSDENLLQKSNHLNKDLLIVITSLAIGFSSIAGLAIFIRKRRSN